MPNAICVDLVLDNGEIVRISCPVNFENELFETLEHTMRRRDWWAPGQFNGCSVECFGYMLDRVNMGRVVGML